MPTVDNQTEYKAPTLSPRELIETFPEAIPVIKRNLKIARHDLPIAEKISSILLDYALQKIYSLDIPDDYKEEVFIPFAKWYFYDSVIGPLKKKISNFEQLILISKIKNAGLEGQPLDIAKAKSYPIESLIKVKSSGFALCPFHNDRHESLKIYNKDNRFNCFVCNANGDTIDLVMKIYSLDFKNAIKFLNK